MIFKKIFSREDAPIFVERFSDEKAEPLFLCERNKNLIKRLKKRKDFVFLNVNAAARLKYKRMAVLLIIPVLTIAILTGGICISIDSCSKNGVEIFKSLPQVVVEKSQVPINLDVLLAVNRPETKNKPDFAKDICDYNGIKCNKVMVENLNKLISAAKRDGHNLKVTGGYIPAAFREQEYERILNEKMNAGWTYITAEAYAKEAIFKYYEYETGLSVNLCIDGLSSEEFVSTDAYKWLSKNSVDYGFVLRAPQGKESKNNMQFSPSFFRFVGTESAQKMRVLSMCLEEYRKYVGLK